MFKTLPVVLLPLAVLLTAPLAASTPVDHVPLTLDGSGVITIPATVNGQGPFMFVLDTGSNRSAVSSDLAARISLPTIGQAVAVTPAGSQDQRVVRIDSLSIGRASRTNVLASVIPGSQLTTAVARVEGIVGQDFLSAFNYTLDYQKKRVSWAAADANDARVVRLPLVKHEGQVLVELRQRDRTLLFVPDSGTENIVIFERNGVVPVSLARTNRRAQLVSVTGTQDAPLMVLRRLLVGSALIENQLALVVPRNEPDAPAGDGLLPLHLFASVTFNSAEGYLVVRM